MKVFIITWTIIQAVLLIVGWVWTFLDRKSKKRKKTPMYFIAIGSFMLAIYFLVFLPMLRKGV